MTEKSLKQKDAVDILRKEYQTFSIDALEHRAQYVKELDVEQADSRFESKNAVNAILKEMGLKTQE